MYPIKSSPKSPTTPQDIQMIKLRSPVQADQLFLSPAEISSVKSTNTIRNNIKLKNEVKKHRTSLHFHENDNGETQNADSISTSSTSSASLTLISEQAIKLATVKRCYSRTYSRSRSVQNSSSGSNRSSVVQSPTDNNVKNNNKIHLYTMYDRNGIRDNSENRLSNIINSNGKRQASNHVNYSENEGDVIHVKYNDHNKGNISHNIQQKCDSVYCKESNLTEDYFLCEKFKNTMIAKLCDTVTSDVMILVDDSISEKGMSMELLSPHEVPIGRRYAEIAPTKNSANIKW